MIQTQALFNNGALESLKLGDIQKLLPVMQKALQEQYPQQLLAYKKIPLEIASKYGLGYAEYGKWPHVEKGKLVKQWKFGRIIFPCTDPIGKVINLCGRAVVSASKTSNTTLYDFLPGEMGAFNAKVLKEDVVFLCNSPFDALSLIAAGQKNACAVFSPKNLNWNWIKAKKVIFCIHPDQIGPWKKAVQKKGDRKIQCSLLPKESYGGYSTLSELWMKTQKLSFLTSVPKRKPQEEKPVPETQKQAAPQKNQEKKPQLQPQPAETKNQGTNATKQKEQKPTAITSEKIEETAKATKGHTKMESAEETVKHPKDETPEKTIEEPQLKAPQKEETKEITKDDAPEEEAITDSTKQTTPNKDKVDNPIPITKNKDTWDEKLAEKLLHNAFKKTAQAMPELCIPWHKKYNPHLFKEMDKIIQQIDKAVLAQDKKSFQKALEDWKKITHLMVCKFSEKYIFDDNIVAV